MNAAPDVPQGASGTVTRSPDSYVVFPCAHWVQVDDVFDDAEVFCLLRGEDGWSGRCRIERIQFVRRNLSQGDNCPISDHPLAKFGFRRPPFWLWRWSRPLHEVWFRLHDAWLVLTGRLSLHRAYQQGYDNGHLDEIYRTVIMKGG